MKRVFLLAVTIFTICLLLISCNEKETNGDLQFVPLDDGTYEVYLAGDKDATTVVIPSTYNDKAVTSIGNFAFLNCTNLTSVTIPNSITNIAESAFQGCTALTSIEIPTNVTNIEDAAFYGTGLESIQIPTSVTHIGASAFANCTKLKSFEFPTSITTIGKSMFAGCISLTSVKIPDTITEINRHAFSSCVSLTSIEVPNSVVLIEESTFADCTKLASVKFSSNITEINKSTFANCISLNNVVVPSKVTILDDSAFAGCTSLTSIKIPTGVTVVGNSTFKDCVNMPSIEIPDTVTTLGESVFAGCINLTSIKTPNSLVSLGKNAFKDCASLTSVVIPASTTTVKENAFSGCDALTVYCEAASATWQEGWNVSACPVVWDSTNNDVADDGYIYTVVNGVRYGIMNNEVAVSRQPLNIKEAGILDECEYKGQKYPVTSILDGAFSDRNQLVSVTIGANLKSMGANAFINCAELPAIDFKNLATVGANAFENCTKLETVTFGNGLEKLGEKVFLNCEKLKTITFGNGLKEIGADAFVQCKNIKTVNISDVESWCNISFANAQANPISIATALTMDGEMITSLVIPDSVTEIKPYAFYYCFMITDITFGTGIKSIGEEAFAFCELIESVNVTDLAVWCNVDFFNADSNPLKIAKNLSVNGTPVESLVIPDTVSVIKPYAFNNCESITEVTFGNNLTTVGKDAFLGCRKLKTVNAASIENWCNIAFENINANPLTIVKKLKIDGADVTSLVIPNTVTEIKPYAFNNCDSITEVTIASSVKKIGADAFANCINLTAVKTSGVEAWLNIEFENVFSNPIYWAEKLYVNNELLTNLEIPLEITEIKANAFYGCNALATVKIHSGVESVAENAFFGHESATFYCEAAEKPASWHRSWNGAGSPVVWDSTNNDVADDGFIYVFVDGIRYGIIPEVEDEKDAEEKDAKEETKKTFEAKVVKQNPYVVKNPVIASKIVYNGQEYIVTEIISEAFAQCKELGTIIIPTSVVKANGGIISDCEEVKIYCEATEKPKDWNDRWNSDNNPVYWYSATEPAKDAQGNYWHYVNGVVTVWEKAEVAE